MMDSLATAFAKSNIGVCVKNPSRRILLQNEPCLKACGDCLDKVCSVGCMELYLNDDIAQWNKRGMRFYRNVCCRGSYFEFALICTEQHIITLMQPLTDRHASAIEYYRTMGLSKRELEIISEVIRRFSNRDICEKLSISKATLKTHLNRIYRKLEDLGKEPNYLPGKRRTAAKNSRYMAI